MLSLTAGMTENTKGLDTVRSAANLINLLGDNPETLQVPAEYSNTYGVYHLTQNSKLKTQNLIDMLYSKPSELRGLYIMGEDPVITFPDSIMVINSLKALEFLVVQDIALTETAKLAHVVLPASSWAEKEGTFTNAEGLTQGLHKAVTPTGQSLPDWQILRNLALYMGKDTGIKDLEEISKEISLLFVTPHASRLTPHAFNPVHYTPAEEPDAGYPLAMVIRDILQHSGSMSTRSKSLDLVVSEALLEVHEEDAKTLGISDNSHVKVTSRRGVIYLKAKVTDSIAKGAVYVPMHFPHSRVNTLTHLAVNGGISIDAVRIEAVT